MSSRWLSILGAQLGLTVVVFIAYLAVIADEDVFPRILGESETWLSVLVLFAGVSVVQMILLAPIAGLKPRRARGVSVWISLVLGGLLFALLAGTLAMSIGHAFFDGAGMSEQTLHAGAAVAVASWLGGTIGFAAFMRARPDATREGLLQLLSRRLLQATAFEVLANIPLDSMIRKKSNCHCGDASLFAFSAAMAVGLVVFGPAVFLTFLRRQREPWYRERCDACGARRGEMMTEGDYREPPAEVCATCGHGGRPERARPQTPPA